MAPKVKDFFFYSREEQRKHAHYKKDGKTLKFWLEPSIELAENDGFKPHEVRIVQKELEIIKDEFINKWEKHFGC